MLARVSILALVVVGILDPHSFPFGGSPQIAISSEKNDRVEP